MAEFTYGGVAYYTEALYDCLADAASGCCGSSSSELAGDPQAWAIGLMGAAVEADLRDLAAPAVIKLLGCKIPSQIELAIQLQLSHRVIAGPELVGQMAALRSNDDWASIRLLSSPLAFELLREGNYLSALREFSVDLDTRQTLMKLYLRFDRPWFLANHEALIPKDAQEAEGLFFWGLRGLDLTTVEAIQRDIQAILPLLGTEVANAISQQIENTLNELRV